MESYPCLDNLYDLRDKLDAFATCVENDPSCTCFYPYTIRETWPAEAEGYFRSTFGYASPGSPEFCYEANMRVCEKIKVSDIVVIIPESLILLCLLSKL